MVVLFSIAGTLLVLAGILGLKFCFQAWRHLQASTEMLCETAQIIDAFNRQNEMAMRMMQESEEPEEASFGVNQ